MANHNRVRAWATGTAARETTTPAWQARRTLVNADALDVLDIGQTRYDTAKTPSWHNLKLS